MSAAGDPHRVDPATLAGVPRAMTGTPPPVDLAAWPQDPAEVVGTWLTEAMAAGVREPLAMTLATVDADGLPDARTVILRRVTGAGWEFSSTPESRKAAQLADRPVAALNLYWREQTRVVRVRGVVEQLPPDQAPDGPPSGAVQWRVLPERVEFWQGADPAERLRVVHHRTADTWTTQVLDAPDE